MQIINPYEIHSAVWIIKRWRWRNEAIAPPPTTFTSPGLEGCKENMKVIAVADLSHNIMQKKMLKSHDAKFLHKLCLTTTLSGLLTDCVTWGRPFVCFRSSTNEANRNVITICEWKLFHPICGHPLVVYCKQIGWQELPKEIAITLLNAPASGVTLKLITSNYLCVIADIAGDVFDFIALIKKS